MMMMMIKRKVRNSRFLTESYAPGDSERLLSLEHSSGLHHRLFIDAHSTLSDLSSLTF